VAAAGHANITTDAPFPTRVTKTKSGEEATHVSTFNPMADQEITKPIRRSKREVIDLVLKEITRLRREYDQIDARLAILESWIEFQDDQSKATDLASQVPTEEQYQEWKPSDYGDSVAEPTFLIMRQIQFERTHFEQWYGLPPEVVLGIGK